MVPRIIQQLLNTKLQWLLMQPSVLSLLPQCSQLLRILNLLILSASFSIRCLIFRTLMVVLGTQTGVRASSHNLLGVLQRLLIGARMSFF